MSAISLAAAPGSAKVDRHRAGIAELGRQRVEPVLAPRREHQPLAARRQLPGELDAEPGRRAGDQRDRLRLTMRAGRSP